MSRLPLDEEQANIPQDYDVRDILAEYWAKATQEDPDAAPQKRGLSRSSLDALRAEEQPEEGVRIYQPKKSREEAPGSVPGPENGESAEPVSREVPEVRVDAQAVSQAESPAPRRSPRELAEGLLARFRREKHPAAARSSDGAREPAALPSFDELLWGKKTGPVRIVEEEEAPAPEPERPAPVRQPEPAPEPEVEIHIPEEELNGLSVNAILAEYWGGLEEEPEPVEAVPLSRSARRALQDPGREAEAAPGRQDKTIPFRFRSAEREPRKEPGREKTRLFSFRKEEPGGGLPRGSRGGPALRNARRGRRSSGRGSLASVRFRHPVGILGRLHRGRGAAGSSRSGSPVPPGSRPHERGGLPRPPYRCGLLGRRK